MRTIDEGPRDLNEINPEKVGYVIAKARELLAEDEGARADASNPDDDGDSVLVTDSADGPASDELRQYIEALDEEESAALVALLWVGRGDFEREEWEQALAQARERRESPTATYLMGQPLLPDYLAEALSAFGYAPGDFTPDEDRA
jgi:thiamine pyrophosphate-dependent acetolactate synthase large subunit-like protein